MVDEGPEMNIAEIMYESGAVKFRYTRYLAPDGTRWIRDGMFCRYYPEGQIASEGTYKDDLEQGLWRDYHQNGVLAAEGHYDKGAEVGEWRYWGDDGQPQDGS